MLPRCLKIVNVAKNILFDICCLIWGWYLVSTNTELFGTIIVRNIKRLQRYEDSNSRQWKCLRYWVEGNCEGGRSDIFEEIHSFTLSHTLRVERGSSEERVFTRSNLFCLFQRPRTFSFSPPLNYFPFVSASKREAEQMLSWRDTFQSFAAAAFCRPGYFITHTFQLLTNFLFL